MESSEFCDSATKAFTQVAAKDPNKSLSQPEERPNGKLYMAVQYSEPQQMMRNEFLQNPPFVPTAALSLYNEWVKIPGESSGSSHGPSCSPQLSDKLRLPAGPSQLPGKFPPPSPMMRNRPQLGDKTISEPCLLGELPDDARLFRKRPSDSALALDLLQMNVAVDEQPERTIKKLAKIKEVVDKAHITIAKETTTATPFLPDSSFRPPLADNKEEVFFPHVIKVCLLLDQRYTAY